MLLLYDFNKKFEEKTGNSWNDRHNTTIHDIKDNKYEFIEMKHQENLTEEEKANRILQAQKNVPSLKLEDEVCRFSQLDI